MRPILRRRLGVVLIALSGLAGCAETGGPASQETALAPAAAPIVKREGVSLADATVALAALDGAPEAAARDFQTSFVQQLQSRGVSAAASTKARYLLRVYLAASSAEGGASLDYVIDVYDQHRIRLARLGDGFTVKGAGDAWSLMSAQALDGVATQCADDVAAFLSNTPEAKPTQAMSYAQ